MISQFAKFTLCALFWSIFANILTVAPLTAAEITECDRLAADPHDPNRIAPGVEFSLVDRAAATKACADALKNDPGNPRLLHQMGISIVDADRKKAFEYILNAAEKGYLASQVIAARTHLHLKNYTESVYWFRKAAEKGDHLSQMALGMALAVGNGVAADPETAIKLLEKWGSQGNSYAHETLGNLYFGGIYQPYDIDLAYKYYRLAANAGNAKAMKTLGELILYEIGEKRNQKEGIRLLEKASELGYEEATLVLDRFYFEELPDGEPRTPENDYVYSRSLKWFCDRGENANFWFKMRGIPNSCKKEDTDD
ncbi:MAG: sel1 repeat family protein [Rhodospirillales bacterium]|nr:sel1 repeat family protein [Rhodospirillales bacterium]